MISGLEVPGKIEAIETNQSPLIPDLIEVPFEITDIEIAIPLLKSTCESRDKTITTKSASLANLSYLPETTSSFGKFGPPSKAVNSINDSGSSAKKIKPKKLRQNLGYKNKSKSS